MTWLRGPTYEWAGPITIGARYAVLLMTWLEVVSARILFISVFYFTGSYLFHPYRLGDSHPIQVRDGIPNLKASKPLSTRFAALALSPRAASDNPRRASGKASSALRTVTQCLDNVFLGHWAMQ